MARDVTIEITSCSLWGESRHGQIKDFVLPQTICYAYTYIFHRGAVPTYVTQKVGHYIKVDAGRIKCICYCTVYLACIKVHLGLYKSVFESTRNCIWVFCTVHLDRMKSYLGHLKE